MRTLPVDHVPAGPSDLAGGYRRARRGVVFCGVAPVFLVLIAGGDPYGGREPLWNLCFETVPRLIELYGTRAIPAAAGGGARRRGNSSSFPEAPSRWFVADGGRCCPGNVIVVLPGSAPDAIIVSAHLDRAGAGEGALDDFSGVVMLGMLYTYFRDRPLRHTLVFAAFDGEETAQAGSRWFVEKSGLMPEAVTAVVNLECLGDTFPRPWAEGSSDWLENLFVATAALNRMDIEPVSIETVSADSVPFIDAGYPAITIQGIKPEHVGLLGTEWDRHSLVRGDIFDTTFITLTDFIRALDALGAGPHSAQGR